MGADWLNEPQSFQTNEVEEIIEGLLLRHNRLNRRVYQYLCEDWENRTREDAPIKHLIDKLVTCEELANRFGQTFSNERKDRY